MCFFLFIQSVSKSHCTPVYQDAGGGTTQSGERKNFYYEKYEAKRKCEKSRKRKLAISKKNKPLTAVIVKCCSEIYLKYVICMCALDSLYC